MNLYKAMKKNKKKIIKQLKMSISKVVKMRDNNNEEVYKMNKQGIIEGLEMAIEIISKPSKPILINELNMFDLN